jgi:hypothetical protein
MTMAGSWMDKIKDFAKGNPQQADTAIEKVEDLIDKRTGGKYEGQVDKGGDALRDQLGLPDSTPEPAPAPAPEPTPTPEPEPAPAPAPEPPTTPAPNPSPSTGDPQPGSDDGPLIPGDSQQQEPADPAGTSEPQADEPVPGGDQPDTGGPVQVPTDEPGSSTVPEPGPDAEGDTGAKELPPFGRS